MALWYDCGNGMAKTSFAKKDAATHAYVLCPGPSLSKIDPHVFDNKLGITTFGLTTSYPQFKPHYWIGMDRVECYDRLLWWEPFVKICRGNYSDMLVEGTPIKPLNNVFFADCGKPQNREDIFTLRSHDVKFVWHSNSFAVALHLMVWMGFKKIHFVGCDLTKGYFDGRMIGTPREASNQRLYEELFTYMKWFVETGTSKYGMSFVSCSETSRLNAIMDYVPIDAAINNSSRHLEKYRGLPIFHAADAERMYHSPPQLFDNTPTDKILFQE